MFTKNFDPWLETVHCLIRDSGGASCGGFDVRLRNTSRFDDPRRGLMLARSHENAQVFVRERLTDVTIVVDWSDSTMCNYVCQIWRTGRASEGGRCALSGRDIRSGEAVYRPIPLRPSPSNANAMICAEEVDEALRHNLDDGLGVACHQSTRRHRR